jgi:archaellum component FlaG (FlaF/FlaG flagellin family)
MDKVISTVLLIIVSMILVMLLFNAAYPAVLQGSDAIINMADRADERMKSQISIIHASGELDSTGFWQDTNGDGQFEVFLWVKNVGSTRLTALQQSDLFFGPEGNFAHISYDTSSYPYWTSEVENAAEWTPTATLKITIHYGVPLTSGRYFVQMTLPNGVSAEYFMGM